MQSSIIIDLDYKSESKRMPISNSVLFFSSPLFKHKFLHLRREGARKSIEGIK